jgi:hypothetical protein
VGARGLEEVQRADGVHLEVVEWPLRGEVVRGLGGGVDDQGGPCLRDEPRDPGAVADVEVVVLEATRLAPEPLEVPGRVPVRAEEVAPHVVVDAVHAPAALVEEGHHLRPDEPAGAGDESGLRACHGS